MSSSTPNIGLTLPVGGENVSRQIINENNTKIDNYAGTLNSKLLKPITVTVDPITNGSGSYNHTTSGLTLITEDMKAIDIEVGTPETFKAPVTVTTGNHTVNVSCPSVSGSSTITITFIHTEPVDGGQNVPAQITSAEFDILAGRIGNLSSLQTSVKTDTVSAINSLSEQIANVANYAFGTAKVVDAIQITAGVVFVAKIDCSNIVPNSKVVRILGAWIGANPAGNTMMVAQNTGSNYMEVYMKSDNTQDISANSDVAVALLYKN